MLNEHTAVITLFLHDKSSLISVDNLRVYLSRETFLRVFYRNMGGENFQIYGVKITGK